MNQKWPDLHKLRLTNLQKYFDMRTQFIARVKDHKGRRIFVCRIGNPVTEKSRISGKLADLLLDWWYVCTGQWNPSVCSLDDFFHCAIYCFQILAADCETQIKGIAIIFDFNGFALHQARCITPGFAKKMASVLQVTSRATSVGVIINWMIFLYLHTHTHTTHTKQCYRILSHCGFRRYTSSTNRGFLRWFCPFSGLF